MTGELKITVDDKGIYVVGTMESPSLAEETMLLDALMNCFKIKGALRRVICDMLIEADHHKSGKTKKEEDLEFLLDLLKSVNNNDDEEDDEDESGCIGDQDL